MEKASFVGVCMSGPGGADFPKVFQSGHVKLLVEGLPAQTMNTLKRGASYEILYDLDQVHVVQEEPEIFRDRKAEATKL
ncbi:MAG: hypothetical protein WC819_05520 [Parcubacteria group bacterium]|jgi:hypothetical protein